MGDAGGREAVEEAILVSGAPRFDPSGTLGMGREDLRISTVEGAIGGARVGSVMFIGYLR
jgi:hypothetical protein